MSARPHPSVIAGQMRAALKELDEAIAAGLWRNGADASTLIRSLAAGCAVLCADLVPSKSERARFHRGYESGEEEST